MADLLDRARTTMSERAELPGMSLLEHLQELRKRIIYSLLFIGAGFCVAYGFHDHIAALMIEPITRALAAHHLDTKLAYLNPMDPFNFYLKIGLFGGIIIASPFVLYQVWLFIAPGLYQNEKRYVVPFMSATVGLFLAGAYFGYQFVYPGALTFLIGYGSQFKAVVTIAEYMELFLTVILGLGIVFELPILVFFLSLFGIVSSKWLWKNVRYAILIIFIVAGIITPTPDPLSMCIFATPMLALYFISIGIAHLVHPDRRNLRKKEKQES
jgi:sec-independent protein translocase protein TatC